ncbi:MAG TPA: hypothetical protein VI112_07740 [Bacteroidia bacterium]|jgi:tetratricopeptide (TPR) repeat protein
MDVLQQVIGTMNKEDQRSFKLFINRIRTAEARKDEQLFDHIRNTHPEYDEDLIHRKLYGKTDKNSLYRLKNRLLEDISKSITLQYYNDNEYNSVLYCIALTRLYTQKGLNKVAFFYLGKAEKAAASHEFYELLDLIYSERIRLSHETLEINPEEYISKRKENRDKLNKVQEIDDILAALIYRIKTTQLFSGKKNTRILDILQETVRDFSHDKAVKKSPALRFRIYHALSRILLQREDYNSLEKYLLKTYSEFSKEGLFNRNNHDTKLQMLTYIVNSLFKNGKLDASLQYGEKLHEAMREYDKLLHDKYLFFYYSSQVINYSVKDLDKAISILNVAKDDPVIRKVPMHVAFIYLNLSVTYFDKGDFKTSLRNLVKLTMDDSFKKLDDSFRLKVAIAELMIRYELGDVDYIEHRTRQLMKEFIVLHRSKEHQRDFDMVKLIVMMTGNSNVARDKKINDAAGDFVRKNASTSNDIISYTNWLRSKCPRLK